MDNLIGIKTKNFTLIASDMTISSSILSISSDQDKFQKVQNVYFAYCGDSSKTVDFDQEVKSSLLISNLYKNVNLNCNTVSNFLQNKIYERLRKDPINANYLIMDKNKLMGIDMYGALFENQFICFGYSRLFLYGLIEDEFNENMSLDQGIELLQKCIDLLNNKFLINYLKYKVYVLEGDEVKNFVLRPRNIK